MSKVSDSFLKHIKFNEWSATPKYRQLMDAVVSAIQTGTLSKGDLMPSINEMSFSVEVSRLTVEKSYKELRKLGLLEAYPGKGYFVKSTETIRKYQILLLFNKLSSHKKVLYDTLIKAFGENAAVDFYVYNNDATLFTKILEQISKDYTHYIVVPYFIDDENKALQEINKINPNKLIILNHKLPALGSCKTVIYENFSKDIYFALDKLRPKLEKYKCLKLLFPENSYFSIQIIEGFKSFCKNFIFEYEVIYSFNEQKINEGDVCIILDDDDLFTVLEIAETKKMEIGKDLGLISYNETKAKKYIGKGITTISTNFELMGFETAKLILEKKQAHIEIPFEIFDRNSL